MKKNPIIFIAMLIALAFTSCQMNTDDSVVTPPAPTYTITVTGDQTNGSAKVTNVSDEVITSAKAGENVTLTVTPKSGYKFDATITINGQSETQTDSAEHSYTMAMPSSNITVNVSFTQISNNGGEDNGTDEPPATTNEYTVSVASGIKGGHIEVSLDNATWTTLSTSTKYAKNTKLYVRAVADKHYKYSSGIDESVITITENKTLNATFEIVKETLGSVIVTPTLEVNDDLLSSKYIVEIQIANDKFNAGWNKAKIALGFDEDYYYGLTETSLVGGPKYYYAYPTEISTFKDSKTNTMKVVYISINGENFEIPDVGKFYLVLENNNQTELCEMATSKINGPNHFRVEVK